MNKRPYTYAWITVGFFVVSWTLHWIFGWYAFANDASEHGSNPEFSKYAIEALRDTFQNWQSEFIALLWQVVGLTYFLYKGSPNSKEGNERLECKIDELLRRAGTDESYIKHIDERYMRK